MNRLTNSLCVECNHYKYLHEGACVVVRCPCREYTTKRHAGYLEKKGKYKFQVSKAQYPKARITSKAHSELEKHLRRYDSI